MPYLGSTLFVVVLIVSLLIAVNAYLLLVRAVAPKFVARARTRWSKRPVVTTLLGAVVGGFASIVAIALLSVPHPAVKFIGAIASTFVLAFAFAGATAFASQIGAGLSSPTDRGREWFQTLKGGIVLELAAIIPILGWFLIAPVTLLGGFGAAILGLFPANQNEAATSAHVADVTSSS